MTPDDNGTSWPIVGQVGALLAVLAGIATSVATLSKVFEQPFYLRLITIGCLGGLTMLSVVVAATSWPKKLTTGTNQERKAKAVRLLVMRGLAVVAVAGGEVLILRFAADFKSVKIIETGDSERRGLLLKAPYQPTDMSLDLWVDQLQHLDVDIEKAPRAGLTSFMNVRSYSTTILLDGFGDRDETRLRLNTAIGVPVGRKPTTERSVECLEESDLNKIWWWSWEAGGVVCVAGFVLALFRSLWVLRVASLAV
jgi:hypothetical protein